jgi:hypothetical protein
MRRLTAAAVAVVALGLASPAAATTAQRLSREALTRTAEVIVVGRAVDQRSRWLGRNLVTLVTIAVDETLKGEAGDRLTVVLPGGVDASRRIPVAMSWPAAPVIRTHEEVILFLVRSDEIEGAFAVVGFSQGKFSIVGVGAGRRVSRDLGALLLVDGSGSSRGARTREPLARFRAEVLRRLAGD